MSLNLKQAIERDDDVHVLSLLSSDKVRSINNERYAGVTPLHAACQRRNIKILSVLLNHGAQVRKNSP